MKFFFYIAFISVLTITNVFNLPFQLKSNYLEKIYDMGESKIFSFENGGINFQASFYSYIRLTSGIVWDEDHYFLIYDSVSKIYFTEYLDMSGVYAYDISIASKTGVSCF
jgi:hypothetical protein